MFVTKLSMLVYNEITFRDFSSNNNNQHKIHYHSLALIHECGLNLNDVVEEFKSWMHSLLLPYIIMGTSSPGYKFCCDHCENDVEIMGLNTLQMDARIIVFANCKGISALPTESYFRH